MLRWFKKKKKSEETPPDFSATDTEDQPASKSGEPELKPEESGSDPEEKTGFFKRLRKGLAKTREILTTDIDKLFTDKTPVDEEFLEQLEELLITSDIGVQTAMTLMDSISKKRSKIADANQLKALLKEEILSYLGAHSVKSEKPFGKPHVILVLGVNGVGKTTTIGKLAAKSVASGKKVLIAAADTFRAAAIEQLTIWAERAGADIVKHRENADPSAVVYDCMEAAVARGVDLVLIDTAGRLHTRVNLMEELKKIRRTIAKKVPEAPHETLLVLDATTGQNALSQAKMFNEALGVTGIVLTKLDGTAKGGIVVTVCGALKIPLEYIGVGEQIEDLQEFDRRRFVDAMF